jgi:hypothetical protein
MKTILATILSLQIIIVTIAFTTPTPPPTYKILIANLPQYGITEILNQCKL